MPPFVTRFRALALAVPALVAVAACGSDDVGELANPGPAGGGKGASSSGTSSGSLPAGADASTPGKDSSAPQPLGAPYPIVLVHGMAGFEELKVGQIGVAYWNGVQDALAADGETSVFVTETSPYNSSEVRARELAPQVDAILKKTGHAKVNIIAHSQGGLDARLLASPQGLGFGDRIASITTIATPHFGTRVADVALGLENAVPGFIADSVTSSLLGFLQRTVYDRDTDVALRAQLLDLSVRGAKDFNAKYIDDPRVVYESYAGRSNLKAGLNICDDGLFANEPLNLDAVTPVLSASATFLEAHIPVEINDGLVPVASAKWGTFLGCIPADHFKEVGHKLLPVGFDHLRFYRKLVNRLRSVGR